MIVLWLLIMRGVSVELRMQIDTTVWRSFFDGLFFFSSAMLAIFFGAALANVIRGVPLTDEGYFFLPLWTNWRVGDSPGILDWYTVIGGIVALVALATHGALYVAVKTEGELQKRARHLVRRLSVALLLVTLISLPATMIARPDSLANYLSFPLAFAIPVVVFLALAGILYFCRKESDHKAFACSCAYLAVMLVGAAFRLVPASATFQHRPGARHHGTKSPFRSLRVARRTGVVVDRNGSGFPLFFHYLSNVSGKGFIGRQWLRTLIQLLSTVVRGKEFPRRKAHA